MIDEMFNIVLDPLFPPKVVFEIPTSEKQFTLIYSEPMCVSKRLKNDRSLSKNYYPCAQTDSRPSSISKLGRTEDVLAYSSNLTERERDVPKLKYSSPPETIKFLLDTYFYSDFTPFDIPVSILLSSNKLADPQQLETNLKNIRMITDTRVHPMLAEPKYLEMCVKILKSDYPQKIKVALMQGLTNCSKQLLNRKRILEIVLPEVSKVLIDLAKQKQ
jgi:hypothetical protein